MNEDLSEAKVVFGVKQVPIDNLLPDRTYVFFSHTIKGQPTNMPMLQVVSHYLYIIYNFCFVIASKLQKLILYICLMLIFYLGDS